MLVSAALGVLMMNTHSSAARRLPDEGGVPSIEHATGWLNSPPLRAADLRGKVVLVDFWTYTCINWRRTLPYLRSWADKYREQGLVVIGVHTPEFSFERNVDNVRRASSEQAIGYPIAIDSEYAIWRAFGNQYWPAVYLVDAQGRIRHHQFGEGDYDNLEFVIRQLLTEAGHPPPPGDVSPIKAAGAEAEADWKNLRSPETYLGHGRSESFASPEIQFLDKARDYTAPERLRVNDWAFAGSWSLGDESARSSKPGGRLTYRFHARDVHLVMGPAASGGPVRFRVFIDGQPAGASRGVDIDENGNGKLDMQRMYHLIRQHGPIVDRNVEIEFLDPGAELFVLTFG
jgi:thiol-disulfide isomerase/thioredoxin